MLSLSPIKIMVIVAVVLVLLGPDKLPEVAHKLGSSWRALKRLQERVEAEVREAIPDLPSTGDIARIARSPVNLLNSLADRVDAKEDAEGTTDDDVPTYTIDPYEEPSDYQIPTPRPDSAVLPPDPSLN
ncbi:MAG: Sec-independent protein translocase subunit TatA/TatB [Acidimicrobiales bacterium]